MDLARLCGLESSEGGEMSKLEGVYSREELRALGRSGLYEGEHTREIAFPLGGIGTGCISLSGRGSLMDWEIFNRPNKGTILPYTFFALWARREDEEPVTRVLQTPPQPPFTGEHGGRFTGLGFGVPREDGSGLPHMRSGRFKGQFPFAEIEFDDPRLPVSVALEAYSPFIPLDADASGIPIAVLRYHVTNGGPKPVELSLVGNIYNPLGYPGYGPFSGDFLGQNRNAFVDCGLCRGLYLTSKKYPPEHPAYGSIALSTTWNDVGLQNNWLRGRGFDPMHSFWDSFSAEGTLPPRDDGPSAQGTSDVGSLLLRATLAPGAGAILPFFITWYLPNFVMYWKEGNCSCCSPGALPQWRNYYASQWSDALDVAAYYASNEASLYERTRQFHRALFSSTLPGQVMDALSSQASILHSPTVLRLEDGTFYGFEGCHSGAGCCEGSCTHVWNYAQTVAYLFPDLERSMRQADYAYNLREDGSMGFRLQLPLGNPPSEFYPAADGQMGGLLKLYRDWLLGGDDQWLAALWPKAKKALEYAWVQWDPDRDGVMEGVQHNTYDIEFHGPNTMTGSFYLGALRAAEEMARHLGDEEAARTYHEVFTSGRERIDRELYNGEYYRQVYDPKVAPKYQYGEGCLADQVIGQWFAHLVDLGYLLDPEHVRSAIRAVFEHNWMTEFWEHPNPQRIYALNDERGLLVCTWPRGGRPELPLLYCDEVWCGCEYQVASHLIYEGFVDEGLAVVKGLRDRYDGLRRNPWNEFECGNHYARSLASWALMIALSGFSCDLPQRTIGFAPRLYAEHWSGLWSTGTGWGMYSQDLDRSKAVLEVYHGFLDLAHLRLAAFADASEVRASLDGEPVATTVLVQDGIAIISFRRGVRIGSGQSLTLEAGGC